jgi:hypothetical protein
LEYLKQDIEDPKTSIYVVSDGGVYNYHSNFGVSIASASLPLAHTFGKIYSTELYEASYGAEIYRMLAGTVLLQHVLSHHSI